MSVVLKKFQPREYKKLISWIKSKEFMVQWAGPIFEYPLTEQQLNNYRDGMPTNPPGRKIYSVFNADTDEHIGHIELNDIDLQNNSAKICRVLIGNEYIGKGYGKEIVKAIIKLGFEDLQFHRIDLRVFDFNTSAVKCYESVGFVHEGILREARKVDNEYWNLLQMSILKKEYEKKYL